MTDERYEHGTPVLDRVIELQEERHTLSDIGAALYSYVPYARVWAGLEKKTEPFDTVAGKVGGRPRVVFVIRFDSKIRYGWRVVYDGIKYTVRDVIEFMGRKRFLRLECEEVW